MRLPTNAQSKYTRIYKYLSTTIYVDAEVESMNASASLAAHGGGGLNLFVLYEWKPKGCTSWMNLVSTDMTVAARGGNEMF